MYCKAKHANVMLLNHAFTPSNLVNQLTVTQLKLHAFTAICRLLRHFSSFASVFLCVLAVRKVTNATGLDLFVPKFDTTEGAGRETLYHVIVISVMSVFKTPRHTAQDVVQFSVSRASGLCTRACVAGRRHQCT